MALACGHKAVARLLIESSKIDPATTCEGLCITVRNRRKSMVELLIGMGKIDLDWKNLYGKAALTQTAIEGDKAIVKLLVDTGKVTADPKDDAGKTALLLTATYGHVGVVKLLVKVKGGNTDLKDKRGGTLL